VIGVSVKIPLEIRLGICIYKTSLLHRPDDYIGFTPSCPPIFYNEIAPMDVERIKRFVNVHLHCIVSNIPSECANTQDHQNCYAVKSHSRVLATFQSSEKARKQEAS